MTMPKFSIIMPCYNAARTVNATIASLLNQSEQDWELICVDDHSTDETWALLAGWARMDGRIRTVRNPAKGPSHARNFGARLARAKVLCFCDADDLWAHKKLACLSRAFRYEGTDAVFGRVAFFRTPGKADTFSTVPNDPLTIAGLLGENPVCTLSNLSVRRQVFLTTGGFDPSFVHNEDLDWLIRAIGQGAVIHGHRELHVWYRSSPAGLSADVDAMRSARLRILERVQALGITPDRRAEAIYMRYLARRALRLNQVSLTPLTLTLAGLWQSPLGFLLPLHRGTPTLLASLCAPLLPQRLRHTLFAR